MYHQHREMAGHMCPRSTSIFQAKVRAAFLPVHMSYGEPFIIFLSSYIRMPGIMDEGELIGQERRTKELLTRVLTLPSLSPS